VSSRHLPSNVLVGLTFTDVLTLIGDEIMVMGEYDPDYRSKRQDRTAKINRLQKRHPGTRRQRNSHGAGMYSVDFFDKKTGKLVASYDITRQISEQTWG